MDQHSFRAVIAVLACIVVASGLYLGWHYTHRPAPCPRIIVAERDGC